MAFRGQQRMLVIERLDPIYADFTISQSSLTAVQHEQSGALKVEVHLPVWRMRCRRPLTFLDNAVQTLQVR